MEPFNTVDSRIEIAEQMGANAVQLPTGLVGHGAPAENPVGGAMPPKEEGTRTTTPPPPGTAGRIITPGVDLTRALAVQTLLHKFTQPRVRADFLNGVFASDLWP